jgi:large repetitive protein
VPIQEPDACDAFGIRLPRLRLGRLIREEAPLFSSVRTARYLSRFAPRRGILVIAALVSGLAFAWLPSTALAASSPAITIASGVPATVLYGGQASVSMTAANPAGQPPGYNLSFRDVLPAGVSYAAGSSRIDGQDIEPQVIANAPAAGQTTLIWSNVSDLSASSSNTVSYRVSPSSGSYAIASNYTESQSAYVNSNARYVPQFDALGNPVADATSYTGSAATSGTTTVTGISVSMSDSAGAKLLRGAHTHQTVYTVTVANNTVNPTTSAVVDTYLPAGLEFLGCGAVDNTTSAATNPGSTQEWPGSGALSGHTAAPASCATPTVVQTATMTPGGLPSGVYTHVQYSPGTIPAGQSIALRFVAAVPIRQNTSTWTGVKPSDASDGQTANLDNNSGPETSDGQTLPVYSSFTGLFNGVTAVSASSTLTVTAKDDTITKTVDTPNIAIGDTDVWTLAIAVGEYRYVQNLQVADAMPNGTCPLDSTNHTSSPDCAPNGQLPSSPYTTIAQAANGTWSETWDQTTDPALAQMLPDSTTTITIPVKVMHHYQTNGADTTPVLAGDSWTGSVVLTSSDYVRCGGASANAACPGGAIKIAHDMADNTTITDSSSASQTAGQPVVGKTIDDHTSVPVNCLTDNYVSTAPVYSVGDVVCYKLHIDFPAGAYTGSPVITDFLPPGSAYNTNSWQTTGLNTTVVKSVDATTNAGVLSVTLGDANGNVAPDQTLDAVYSVTLNTPTAAGQSGLTGNLMKFANVNTVGTTFGGQSFPQRAAVNLTFSKALLSLSEGIDQINGLPSGGNPANTDNLQVAGGDQVTVRVDVTNSGGDDADGTEVWEDLPAQLTCSSVGTISDAGACNAASTNTVRWTGITVPAGQTKTLTYTYTVAAGSFANQTFPSHAGVRDYQSATDSGTNFVNIPTANIDPNVATTLGTPNTAQADDITDVFLGTPTLGLVDTTSVNEAGNATANQATIGERTDYTATLTIPAGVTQGSTSSFSASIGTQQSYVPSSAAATMNGGLLPGGATLTANGSTVVVSLPSGYSSSTVSTVLVTWSATLNDIVANKRSSTLAQASTFAYDAGAAGTVANANASASTTTIVEPTLTASLTSTAVGKVAPGQAITYTAKLSDPTGINVSSADHSIAVVTVPVGETPVNGSGNPVADGGTVAGGGAGVWAATPRTVTFPAVSQILPVGSASLAYNVTVDNPLPSSTSLTTNLTGTTTSLLNAATAPGTARTAVTAAALLPPVTGYTATATANVVKLVDATVTKTVSAPTATIGDPETYTVLVTIPAGVNLYDALVRDTLHDGISYDGLVSASCTSGCGGAPIPISEIPHSSNSDGTTTLGFWLGEVPSATSARVLTIVYDAHVLNTYHTAVKVLAGQTLNNAAEVDDNQSQTLSTTAPATIPATSAYTYRSSPAAVAAITVVEPSITLAKAVSDPSTTAPYAQPVDQLTYTLTVTNAGTSTAYDVPVTDTPAAHIVGLVAQTGASYVTQAWTAGTPTMAWYIPSIPAGQSVTLTYTATLAASASLHNGEVDANSSSVTGYYGESDAVRTGSGAFPYRTYASVGPKSASVTVALPQLSVSNTTGASGFPKTANAEVDQPFGWRPTVSNTSPAATADNAGLTYQLPANWTYIAGSAGSFGDPAITNNAGGQLLTWTNLGNIAPGGTVTIPFTAQPTVAAAQNPGSGPSNLNTASESDTANDKSGAAASADGAYAAGPNTANADLLVPALSVTKTPKNGTFTAGSPGAWTIKVANAGTGTARNVTVSDDTPAGDAFSSGAAAASPSTGFSQTGYDSSGPTTHVTWTIASIAAGANVTITVPTTVASNLASAATLTNTAQAQSTEEPTPVPDTGNVTIATSADVAVTNSVVPSPATAGGDLEYTINVTNNGPSDAQGVTLSDPLPPSAAFVAFDSGGSSCSQAAGSISCSFGTLAAGANQQVKVHVKLASNAPASVSDTATVVSTTHDPSSANNTATAVVAVGRTADLSLTDSASPASVVQGQDVSFTLTAADGGPSDAPNTVITDVLPDGLSFVSASAGCTNSSGTVTCVAGSLADGADAAYTVVVEARQVGSLVDAASVTSGAVDPNTSNNSADGALTVGPAVDLAIGDAGPATVAAGGSASYAWTVSNDGPSDGTGVSVSDVLAAGETFESVTTPAGWSCTSPAVGANGTVTCSHAGVYPDGASDVFDLSVNVGFGLADQTVLDAPSVSGDETDPDLSNNTPSVSTAVGPAADLSLTDSPSPTSVVRDAQVTYTLVASNAGPDNATGVVVTDVLPSGLSFVSASSGCVNSLGVVTCSLGSIADGFSQTATVVVRAEADGHQVDSASVSADQPDPDMSNNSAGGALTVGPAVDLNMADTGSATVAAGGSASYTWTVTNDGPDDGTGVSVSDLLPAGLSFVSAVPDQGNCSDVGQAISCSLGSLADGSSATVTVVASASFASAGQTLVDAVSVSGHENDPNEANNDSSASTIVGPAADVSITDTADDANPAQQQDITYTLSYANHGPSSARNVIVVDTLPTGTTFKSVDDAACVASGGVVTCHEGTIASGASGDIRLVASADQLGVLHDAATVSSDEPDPDSSNNSASADVTDGPTADLTLSKTTSTPDVAGDGVITYRLAVHNAGPSAAGDVVLTDPLPSGETLVDATVPDGSCAEILSTVTCTIAQVDVGDLVAATLHVRAGVALANSTVINTATVAADEVDTNPPASQTSSVPVNVGPATDVPVVEPPPASAPVPGGCPRPTGRIVGRTLGRFTLMMSRAQGRERLPRFNVTENNFDNFCLAGGWGIRTGYPSALLLRSYSAAVRAAVRGRVVLALTANPYYVLRGIRPGATRHAAIRALDGAALFHVGLNYWYLAPNGSSTAIVKVRNGRVQEIGIADRKLTKNRKSRVTFINSFI